MIAIRIITTVAIIVTMEMIATNMTLLIVLLFSQYHASICAQSYDFYTSKEIVGGASQLTKPNILAKKKSGAED